MEDIDLIIKKLYSKNNSEAYKALLYLESESKETNITYPFFELFLEMLDNKNSYIRLRGLLLISANAQWDIENKIDKNIDLILAHIVDEKPTVSRQFIQSLPNIIRYKPCLTSYIRMKLKNADISIYNENMQSLVIKDINKVLDIVS